MVRKAQLNPIVLAAWLLIVPGAAVASSIDAAAHLIAGLHAESRTPRPGGSVALALQIRPQAGWHLYWKNPGESGLAPQLHWTLPKGVSAGEPQYPIPSTMTVNGITSNVYEGAATLLVELSVAGSLPRGTRLPVRLNADVLTCTEGHCVPQSVLVDLRMIAGDGKPDPAEAERFAAARAALPRRLEPPLGYRLDGDLLELSIPGNVVPAAATVHVFFDQEHPEPAATQTVESTGGNRTIVMSWDGVRPGGRLSGVIRIDPPPGSGSLVRGYRFSAKAAVDVPPAPARHGTVLWLVLGGAILGGLLLNLMPCVLPILSIKAAALARAGGDGNAARVEAVCYTTGAVTTLVGLGAVVLAFRSAGSAIGWAFQLQDPRLVAVLLLLVTVIATNLAGLFELTSLAAGSPRGNGIAASFGAGALAAFVATPCTGPFMAGALGAALVLPAPQALAVFAGLGFGLALPFLGLGFFPFLRAWLPRPGPWMVTFRRLLSLPMFATALGLAWIVGREAGVGAMAFALGASMLTAAALWWYGLNQTSQRFPAIAMMVPALVALASVALGLPSDPGSAGASDTLHARPYSAPLLAELRAEHHPVFLYLTADWCMTCKVNEAVSLSAPSVSRAFSKAGVTVLEGDWTRGDPRITRFLAERDRAGVPLYVWYPARGAPKELPQLLTPAMLAGLTR